MERANQIIIQTQDEPEDAYRNIASILTGQGLTISSSDPVLYSITTERKQLDASFIDEAITSRAIIQISSQVRSTSNNTQILLTGRLWIGGAERQIERRTARGQARNAWNALNDLANKYPNGRLMYARN
ncbi:hypothetical protein [Natronogracilivirga saccharolytica]|uniref:Uncharacterized protein n=1 Tax=Natronogracilivirga saccharolytica TaxID=2812953 RepID=A0A8J7RU87_9BACT|nr:hypothetical protein [Natronogracilivirga saccharolytica]MBP3193062.1 hypothetical protein [Natronogracilivirga saccharolytica]